MTERVRKAWAATLNTFYVLAALGCFGLAIYSIWLDRAGSAGVAATFAVAFLLLRHLPIIESFKAFNIEAKFARRVDEFDRLMTHIRSAAEVSSRLLYTQLGFSGRMASISWERKRELMTQLDRNLEQLGVEPQFIREAKRPVLNFATWDLLSVFRGCAQSLANRHLEEIRARMKAISSRGPIDAGNSEWAELNKKRVEWSLPRDSLEDMAGPTRLERVGELIDDVLKRLPWTASDKTALSKIGSEVESLAAACWDTGSITAEAQEYIEKYASRQEERLKELELQQYG